MASALSSVFYASGHTSRSAGNVHEYFRMHARRYVSFVTGSLFYPKPTAVEVYEGGALVRRHEYRWSFGGNGPLRNVCFFLQFFHARLFFAPSRTTVLTHNPLYCFCAGLFRLWRHDRTIYWVWDFYDRPNPRERLFNALNDWCVARLPLVLFISQASMDACAHVVRRLDGAVWQLAPLGIRAQENPRRPEPGLFGFIGNLKGDQQGLEAVIEAVALDPGLKLELIGAGHAAELLRALAAKKGVADRVTFRGAVLDEAELAQIVARWQLGIAAYAASDFIRYSDPGKLKLYWQLGLPVVTTEENPIHREIRELGGGEVVRYEAVDIAAGIHRIMAAPESYAAGVAAFRDRYEYERLYARTFACLTDPSG